MIEIENGEEKGYRGNQNIRPKGHKQEWTQEQIIEFVKCAGDPIYFIKKYIKIVHVDHGIIPFSLWDFQSEMIEKINENRFSIHLFPRQSGKCLEKSVCINIRNKKTLETYKITIGDFYEHFRKRDKEM
jgi:hypothetical protein